MNQSIAILQELASKAPSHPFHPGPDFWNGLAMQAFHHDPFFSPGNLFRAFKASLDWLQSRENGETRIPRQAKSLLVWNQGRFPLEGFPEVMASYWAGLRPIIRSSPANNLLFRTIFGPDGLEISESGNPAKRSEIAGLIGGNFPIGQRAALSRYFGKVLLKEEGQTKTQEPLRIGETSNSEEAAHFMFAFFGKHPLNRLKLQFEGFPDTSTFLEAIGEYREMTSHFAFSNLIAFQKLTLGIQMVPYQDLGVALLYSSNQQKAYPFPCFSVASPMERERQEEVKGKKILNFEPMMKEYLQDQFIHALNFVENL